MTITKEQQQSLAVAAKPLMDWLKNNCHPHCVVHVEGNKATLTEVLATVLEKA